MANSPFNLATVQPVGTPFLANNGNPNTVYNTSATPTQTAAMHNAAAVGAALPPAWGTAAQQVATPFQSVAMPAQSAYAAPATQFWNNYSGQIRPVFDLSLSGVTNPNPNWTPTTPATPTTPTNPFTPTVPNAGGTGGSDTAGRELPGGETLVLSSGFTGGTGSTATLRDSSGNSYSSRPLGDVMSGMQSIIDRAASGLGFNGRDGSFDANQFVDAITEVFMPGDLYNANVGKWNALNIAKSVLNTIVPGLGKLGEWLASKLPASSALRQWVMGQALQDEVDQAYENILDAPQGIGGSGDGRPDGGGWGTGGSWGTDVNWTIPAIGGGGGRTPIVSVGEPVQAA